MGVVSTASNSADNRRTLNNTRVTFANFRQSCAVVGCSSVVTRLWPVNAVKPGEEAEVVIESAVLEIRPLNALLPGLPLYHFRVVGADFELLRSADKELRLSGFGVRNRDGQEQGSALRELAPQPIVSRSSTTTLVPPFASVRAALKPV